ncbi:MAG: hypothetical protein HC913_03855 [Microscillaceae bacterium]|nr:hypothetical protein [Microscillaceae bacterium]
MEKNKNLIWCLLCLGLAACGSGKKDLSQKTLDTPNAQNAVEKSRAEGNASATSPTRGIYAYRSEKSVEKLFVEYDSSGAVRRLRYQSGQDTSPVKLKILNPGDETMAFKTEREDNKEKLTFSSVGLLGASLEMAEGESLLFSPEIICRAPDGQLFITSGGPYFVPFFYAKGEGQPFQLITLLSPDTPPVSEGNDSVFEATISGRPGRFKIICKAYEENNPLTRIVLRDEKGEETRFTEE